MGLDMYLHARKYISAWKETESLTEDIKRMAGIPTDGLFEERHSGITVEFSAGYWRKAHAVHRWFVESVQNQVDDCGRYEVSREHLQSLLECCIAVLDARKDEEIAVETAESYLPIGVGFFFGEPEFNDYYYEQLKYTKELLTRLLSPEFNDYDFSYQSSW